jgi:iron(III) transport system permease protein
VWAHLWHTQLAHLFVNTAVLVAAVSTGTLLVGTALAWLVVGHEFPGRRLLEWALVLPLALPAYVVGFVFLGLFEFAGPVQTGLRAWVGPGIRLPDPRAGWGVALVMTLAYYPYVYTLARAALAEQAPELVESARALGRRGTMVFLTVSLPLARPALVAGAALAGMEALADFGTVATFGYRTLTEAVYRVWHGMFDRLAATQLAAILLGFAAGLLAIERLSRGRARFTHAHRLPRPPLRVPLRGARAVAATAACSLAVGLGFGLPVAQLVAWAMTVLARDGLPEAFGPALLHSLVLAGTGAGLVTGVALLLAYALRLRPTGLVAAAVRLASLGYAVPGAVIAVGILLPLAGIDRVLATLLAGLTGATPPLLVSGSAAGLLFAYLVRFLAVGAQTVEASFLRIPRSLDEVARSLGAGLGRTLRAIHLPLLHRGLLAALSLAFVDIMKELPATLLLRPLGLETLAIVIWQRTAESLWAEAAVPALALVLAGLVPVAVGLWAARPDPGPAVRPNGPDRP